MYLVIFLKQKRILNKFVFSSTGQETDSIVEATMKYLFPSISMPDSGLKASL